MTKCHRKGHISIKRHGRWECLDCLVDMIRRETGTDGAVVDVNTGRKGRAK